MSRVLIGVHSGEDSPCWEQIQRAIRRYPAICVESYRSEFSTEGERACKQRLCDKFIADGEWWAVADLDEFHQYPLPLPKLIKAAETRGSDHVLGTMVDRLAADGSLPAVRTGDLWRQYPCVAKLTQNLLGGVVQKVMLVKGRGKLGTGHHWLWEGRPAPERGLVHHFKWNNRVLERLEERLAVFNRQRIPWAIESKRFLDFWREQGKFDLKAPDLEAETRPAPRRRKAA